MIPNLTDLQFAVLSTILSGRRSGSAIREELARHGQRKSLAAFYQLMSRMEEAGLVRGWYEHSRMDGHTVKERIYEVEGTGMSAWERKRDFNAEMALLGSHGLAGEAK